jgi:biopolymer transport protein ExbD
MNFRSEHTRQRVLPTEIIALVDVVFLLIIFFLTTSSLVEMTRTHVDLPQEPGESEADAASPGLVLNLTADGSFVVENNTLDLERAVQMVAAEVERAGNAEAVDVLLRGDQAASMVHVNALVERLIELGVTRFRIGTQVPRGGTGGGGG